MRRPPSSASYSDESKSCHDRVIGDVASPSDVRGLLGDVAEFHAPPRLRPEAAGSVRDRLGLAGMDAEGDVAFVFTPNLGLGGVGEDEPAGRIERCHWLGEPPSFARHSGGDMLPLWPN